MNIMYNLLSIHSIPLSHESKKKGYLIGNLNINKTIEVCSKSVRIRRVTTLILHQKILFPHNTIDLSNLGVFITIYFYKLKM